MGLKLKPFGFQAATDRSILSQEKNETFVPFMDKPPLRQLAVEQTLQFCPCKK